VLGVSHLLSNNRLCSWFVFVVNAAPFSIPYNIWRRLVGWQNDDIENSSKKEVVVIFRIQYGKILSSNAGHNPIR
jgi:hypothetical protein